MHPLPGAFDPDGRVFYRVRSVTTPQVVLTRRVFACQLSHIIKSILLS